MHCSILFVALCACALSTRDSVVLHRLQSCLSVILADEVISLKKECENTKFDIVLLNMCTNLSTLYLNKFKTLVRFVNIMNLVNGYEYDNALCY